MRATSAPAMMPDHFVIDRCYMHSNFDTVTQTYSQNLRRAVALNAGATDITNCYIQEVHEHEEDLVDIFSPRGFPVEAVREGFPVQPATPPGA